jgi:predicted transcriptional regulator
VRAALSPLTPKRLRVLSEACGVPYSTVWAIAAGVSANPRIDTVAAILPHVRAARGAR